MNPLKTLSLNFLLIPTLFFAGVVNGNALTAEEKTITGGTITLPSPTPARLAIIIDDLGNSLRYGLQAIALPAPISFAVLPHRKHSKELAERAGRLGKDVLLHAPMSTINGLKLGPGALNERLDEITFKNRLRFSIANTPYVSGINNHMGSQLTTRPQAMKWVMDVLKEELLFFVDSRTNAKSIAFKTAFKMGLPSANRDIFLDHKINIDSIHIQFKKALAIAQQYGSAIAIGHPHKATLTYLDHVLPQLEGTNVAIHSISDLLKMGIVARPDSARESRPAITPNLDALILKLTNHTP